MVGPSCSTRQASGDPLSALLLVSTVTMLLPDIADFNFRVFAPPQTYSSAIWCS
ncbi:hypothetical protein SAMN05660710_00796 [Paracoccus tibetensis]|uniref:Uncharacterized protein n=1 Tax=Paracoccus tibetensis TaxID=336292 RepID=A0A1G5DGK0_9RHOB|nr:hypothetical protein SAMN05660710_00796 [Paracoccus tibetensis]